MSEKKTKPKYSSVENVGWMIANAWRECRSVLLICVIIAVVSVALNLTELFIAPQILQRVENGAEVSSLLLTIAVSSGALFLLMGLKRYFEDNSLYGRIAVRTAIIVKINEKTNTTSYPNMLDSKIQKLRSKAYDATDGNSDASEHIWTTMTTLLTNLIGFIVNLTLLSNLSGLLMLVVIATTVISFFVSRKTDSWRYRHREEEAEYDKRFIYIRNKSESVELAKDIRVFGLAPWLQSIYNSILKLYEGFVKKSEKQKLIGNIVDVLLGVLRNGIAYFYLINMALNENLPASTFLLYFTAVSGFTAWITGILNEFAVLHKESLDLNTIREYLDVPEPFRFEDGVPIPDLTGGCEIKLEKVSFRYPDAEKDTIHDLDLTIAPGEKLAIVGLNGAGKTTLVKLICGLLDPTTGCVLLNGIDIRRFNRQAYYDIFSTVFQDFSVLDISVAENVAQRINGIDRERVDNCLALAGLTEKISELPNGVDTKIGRKIWDDGVELSGGQIQRLMLARALYRDAPMLLLDEPTAALDPLAENDIYVKYPELAAEWSERNGTLTPDKINDRSPKNVWWRCRACGYEWRAVVKARVKGLKCPVCADRAVLGGYNDLATTDKALLKEWPYELNTDVEPTKITRNSLRPVWWRCKYGHAWKEKIAKRTIEGERCPVCEEEFARVLPQLLIMLYCGRLGFKVRLNDEETIGITLDAYIPELKLAVAVIGNGTKAEEEAVLVTQHLCKVRGLLFDTVSFKDSAEGVCRGVKKAFQGAHIYITSDNDDDVRTARRQFFRWKKC